MKKVEQVNRPLKLGEKYLVPCLVSYHFHEENIDEETLWLDLEPYTLNSVYKNTISITPIINHPHSDIENGQKEIHYHKDTRFIDKRKPNYKSLYQFSQLPRGEVGKHGRIEYLELPVVSELFDEITPVELIKNSKLKHKCIHNGKCPHRGFKMNQVSPIDGILTCPLHGLKFNYKTKQMI
jgi:hypothetical protein